MAWGNLTATARWNHLLSARAFANTTLLYSHYGFDVGSEQQSSHIDEGEQHEHYAREKYHSGIEDLSARVDIDLLPFAGYYPVRLEADAF